MYTLLITFFFVSIIFSFLCSIWEAVLLSITPSFTEQKVQEGGDIGPRLEAYKSNIDQPLSAILTLNTIAHTIGAIGVGAQAAIIWGTSLMSTVVVPAVMTLAILLLSEIVPKTIGASYWQELTNFTVRSLKIVMFVLAPFVYISQIITRSLKKDVNASVFSRKDFSAMADLGAKQGVLDKDESTIMRNLMLFESVLAHDIMTPRTVMVAAAENTSARAFYGKHPNLRFSRIPVFENSLDNITGYVLKNDLLITLINDGDNTPLSAIKRDMIAIKENFPIPELFNHFIEKREHVALVIDEFGGTAGLVTMEDVIETLLGLEIVDESDHIVDMQALARKKWEERARRIGLLEKLNKEITEQDSNTKEIKKGSMADD
ncbi:CNNM domain-containing protein [Nitrosomonas sp. Nm51]|uniref:CNNM domain-containing protein n=1 Tax=Nitrosomonas sp. Nm51 TaxID=133720 RepID=UPI000B84067E|nr:CNNM domain-containing protein [Nitrosomonas sp. Nm51]